MSKSKDRILFRLPERYFQKRWMSNGFRRETMANVLVKAFNLSGHEVLDLMDRKPGGFTILCRPGQFARFIVLRCDAGEGINGIKDLAPKIVKPRREDRYDRAAHQLDLHRDEVLEVIRAVGIAVDEDDRQRIVPDIVTADCFGERADEDEELEELL